MDTEGLRQRTKTSADDSQPDPFIDNDQEKPKEEVVWGKTPSGTVFRVPTTHDVLTALFHPSYPKSHLDIVNLALLGLQLVLFVVLPNSVAKPFFLFYFALWRAAYDAGLGWVLTKQSKRKWIVKEVQRRGWLDEKRRPEVRDWIRKQLAGKMGKDYSFDDLPLEYNTWLLFRQAVDIILLNDFLSYCMFAFSCFRVPVGLSLPVHAMRWIGGLALIAFNLWVKTEAHHIVKDYGWYWGDVFFQRGALVFDGVFEMAPHPMYSVGYAGYYGLSLIVGSYPVLFVSLAAHAAQFAFLVLFENPHIERMYGQKKPIALRTPISFTSPNARSRSSSQGHSAQSSVDLSTPTITEGETATETETEVEYDDTNASPRPPARPRSYTFSQHDLLNKYFRKDVLVFRNFDLLRASDVKLILLVVYAVVMPFLPPLAHRTALALHFTHALMWRCFHSFGLGLILRAQSESKFMVRHFVKNYHYSGNDAATGAVQEAFNNWKDLYNLSLVMTYVSFIGLAWKTYSIPVDWTVGDQLLRHTLGALLLALHIWTATESYEVLGIFGWFFGDFFIEDYPASLQYTGIYRFLNNPERTMSGAAFFGLALISGSKLVFSLALISMLSHWWFLSYVEDPHMRKLYGDSLRKDAGLTKIIKNVALKNAKRIESGAGKHAPEIKRVAREVRGTIEKVYEETNQAVEGFLARSGPRISEVVQDARVLLQQSREHFVIAPVASDLSSYDATKYSLKVVTKDAAIGMRFHLGEPISISWTAPLHHSRRDWVGIYRVGANKSKLVTKTSSLGMWVPVHDEEWDGDVPVEFESRNPGKDSDCGEVVFRKDTLPWQVGEYEIRYHHDGKYNVMSWAGPIEVYVDKPASLDFESIRSCLMRIVTLCLDSDPSLIPRSAQPDAAAEDGRDPDDFTFWSERQAKRIATAIKEAFGVEYASEIIVADANISALANRILVSKELLSP